MKSQHVIGNALLNTTLIPVKEGVPANPRISAQIQAFLAILKKVYACEAEYDFDRCLRAFTEEVDIYLNEDFTYDDLIGRATPDDLPPEVPGEMEEFMEKMVQRRKKK